MSDIKVGQTYIAQILNTFPNQGILLIRPIKGQNILKRVSIPNTAGVYGSSVINGYAIGTQVLVYKNQQFKQDRIIGAVASQSDKHVHTKLNNFGNFTWSSWLSNSKLHLSQITELFKVSQPAGAQCNATKYNGDLYSGDIGIVDIAGNSRLLIGESQLLLGQSAAQIRMTGVDNKISMTAHNLQYNTLTTYQSRSPNISKKLIAAQISQGTGVKQGSVIIDSVGSMRLDAKPYFRYQQMNGAIAHGHQQCILVQTSDKDAKSTSGSDSSQPNKIYKSAQQFIPVYKKHIKYSGQASEITAVANRFVKTPNIVSLMQGTGISPKGNKRYNIQSGINTALYLQAYYSDVDLYSQYPVINNKDSDTLLKSQDVNFNNKTIKDQLGFQNDSVQISDTCQYIESSFKQYKDPNTEQTSKISDLVSIIGQQDDGSIIIKDGWGSQIRLHGGNIYISSALDTFIRPGRDLIQMVPRLRDTQTNGSITFTSKDNIRLGAQNNTCISSGISGNPAMTTIQNRSKNKYQNSGVVVRSNSNASITASRDLYIGINDKTKENNKDNTTQSKTGSIVIGGGSQLSLYSGNIYTLADYSLDLFGGKSRIHLDTAGISCKAPQTILDSWLKLTTVNQQINTPFKSKVFKADGSNYHNISTRGKVQCGSSVITGEAKIRGQVLGAAFSTIETPQFLFNVVADIDRPKVNREFIQASYIPAHNLKIAQLMKPSCYSDMFICNNQFKYPDYKEFITYKMIPGMCWQSSTKFKLSSLFQMSSGVVKTGASQKTLAYPGIPFQNLDISLWNSTQAKVQLAKCSNGYKVNRTNYKQNI